MRNCFLLTLAFVACRASGGDTTTPGLRLEPEVRIGSETQGPEYQFTTIRRVAVHGDNVYVMQVGIPEIRVFDAQGKHIQTIGRAGGGPGEFQSLEEMGFVGDTLWTLDGDLRRISFFAPNGKLYSTMPYEGLTASFGEDGRSFFPYLKALIADGSVLGYGGWNGRDLLAGRVTATPLLLISRSGRTLDTLGWVPIGNEHLILQSSRSASFRMQPYSDAPLTVYGPESQRVFVIDRSAATRAGSAQISVVALQANGDTAWTARLPYAPTPLPRSEADSLRDRYHQGFAKRYPASEIDKKLYIPAFRPAVADAIAGADGTLWIRWDDATNVGAISVLDADGRLTREIAGDRGLKIKWAAGDVLWAEFLDANDVPTLVRYRIVQTTRSNSQKN